MRPLPSRDRTLIQQYPINALLYSCGSLMLSQLSITNLDESSIPPQFS